MKIRSIKIPLLLLILGSCTKFKDNDTLLQIGQYKLSVADYEMQKNENKDRFTNEQLENKLIDDGYFLSYALENRYDTIDIISKKIEYAMYDKASKVDGFVWNKKVKPNLVINADDIKYAYNNRSLEYSFEILYFPTKTWLNKFLTNDSKIESGKDFYSLKKRIPSTEEIKFFQVRDYYPFYPLWAYSKAMLSLKKGDVLGPLEALSGYYFVHIVGIENIKQPVYEKEKPKIEKVLLQVLTEKYIRESQKEIFSKAGIKLNEEAIREIAPKYNKEKREWAGTDKNMELMTYKFHGSTHSYKIADLMEYVRCAPVIYGLLSNQDVLRECMENYIIYLYLFDEAKHLKINDDKEFLLFKKQYLEKLFLQYYDESILSHKFTVSAMEARKYHKENRNNFKSFESAIVSVFQFKSHSFALEGYGKIVNRLNQKPINSGLKSTDLNGLISMKENINIHHSDTSYNAALISTISSMKDGEVSMPLNINEEFWVIYLLNKKGSGLAPFKYTEAKIKSILLTEKRQEAHDLLLAELKAKFPLTCNKLKEYNRKTGQ